MLARLLKIWLIVSILGYGMALAADVHGELTVDNDLQLSSGDTGSPDSSADDTGCHHCAHGVSHLLGLSYAGGITGSRSILPGSYLPGLGFLFSTLPAPPSDTHLIFRFYRI